MFMFLYFVNPICLVCVDCLEPWPCPRTFYHVPVLPVLPARLHEHTARRPAIGPLRHSMYFDIRPSYRSLFLGVGHLTLKSSMPVVDNKAQSLLPRRLLLSVVGAVIVGRQLEQLKVPDTIATTGDEEGSQGTEGSFQAFEGTPDNTCLVVCRAGRRIFVSQRNTHSKTRIN